MLGWDQPFANDEVTMRRTALFLGAFLLIAAPITGTALHSGANRAARADFSRLAEALPGLTAVSITTDPWRQDATIEGLTLRRAGLVLRVGRLTLPFAAPQSLFASAAYAQDSEEKAGPSRDSENSDEKTGNAGGIAPAMRNATSPVARPSGTISAENIELAVGAVRYTIKSMELSGTSLTKADLDSIFDPGSTLSLADRLGKFSASQISISEIEMETTLAGQTEKDAYSNIILNGVAQGRVGNATIGSVTSNLTSQEAGSVQSTYGPIKMSGLDLALAARIVSEARSSDTEQRNTLYETVEVGAGKIVMEKSHVEIDMGAFSVKDVKARPLRVPPISAAKIFAAQGADSNQQAVAFVADILNSFEIGSFDLADLRFTIIDADTSVIGTLGRVHLSQMADSKIGEVGFDNLVVESAGTTVKIGGFALGGIDLGKLLDLAETTMGQASASANHAASLVSEISLTGLDVDVADPDTQAHTRFQLAKLDLLGADPVGGIPSHFSTVIDHFTLDLKNAAIGQLDDIVALGYDKLDLSSRLEAHFDASKRQLGLDALSLSGMDMGAVTIAGNFENVSKDLFSADEAQMKAAALSILIRRVEVKVEDAGLLERLIATAARKNNKSPDEIREAYVSAAATSIPTLLGNGPEAKAVGTAIVKFIAAPKNLRIVAVAPDGLGVADLALMKDPNALMNKLSIEAAVDE